MPWLWQNKLFIYRGKEYERLADFNARMQILFPNAEVNSSVKGNSLAWSCNILNSRVCES